MKHVIKCQKCGRVFMGRKNKRFCNQICTNKMKAERYYANISTSSKGAMGEISVCYDLLGKGHHVFRSISPNCPCDLMAIINNRKIRVEVTTGVMNNSGSINFPAKLVSNFDLLAIVVYPDKIYYYPSIESLIDIVKESHFEEILISKIDPNLGFC